MAKATGLSRQTIYRIKDDPAAGRDVFALTEHVVDGCQLLPAIARPAAEIAMALGLGVLDTGPLSGLRRLGLWLVPSRP